MCKGLLVGFFVYDGNTAVGCVGIVRTSGECVEVFVGYVGKLDFWRKNWNPTVGFVGLLGGWDFCNFEQKSNTTGPPKQIDCKNSI